ncbi:hypothetical protein E4U48_002450 [Claviceps purpurea]|nr:hypothetical protein E4U48_002450 [Claviceps purpurea]KAG6306619.1 hypothetical protein E4U45_006788 [Claviceps purpurea]
MGRLTHGNTIKYVKMVASSNFGNVFSMLAAAAWLPFTRTMSIQLLAQNLLYDISQIAIPWDSVDPEYLKTPRSWKTWDLLRFVVVLGPTSSVIDILTFALNWFYYGVKTADNEEAVRLAQTHWFLQGAARLSLRPHWLRHHLDTAYPACLNFAQPSPTFVGFLVAEREAHTPISVRLLSCDIGP